MIILSVSVILAAVVCVLLIRRVGRRVAPAARPALTVEGMSALEGSAADRYVTHAELAEERARLRAYLTVVVEDEVRMLRLSLSALVDEEVGKLRAYVLELRAENIRDHDRLGDQATQLLSYLRSGEGMIRALETRLAAVADRQGLSEDALERTRQLANFALVRLGADEELPSGDLLVDDLLVD